LLCDKVFAHLNLLLDDDNKIKKVKEWALKKMAAQFQTFKKRLYNTYIKKNITPTFTRPLEKVKDHWDAFVEYKKSSKALQRSDKIRQMMRRTNITMLWVQVGTRLLCLSGINLRAL
jgi:hypothetical protein